MLSKKCLILKRTFFMPFIALTLAASLLRPTKSQAIQVGECNIHSSTRTFQTSDNPKRDRQTFSDISDPEVQVDSHVLVSVSELSQEGRPLMGEAIFYVGDVAPYDGGFLLRIETQTQITDRPLDYKIFYTAFTGNCQ